MLTYFKDIIKNQKSGKPAGIYSICSANSFVIEASMKQAKKDGTAVLIESTSNQVDQYGGYTGMKPADFVSFVRGIADKTGFLHERIILGGDHLGPNAWQDENEKEAMEKASVLVREYVLAGFSKIHLDASMKLADDPEGRMKDETVAKRAAHLCAVCEKAFSELREKNPDAPDLCYIIGTEVPIPGGAQEEEETLTPTSPEDAALTVNVTKKAFEEAGLLKAWEKVVAAVVQPGVEFGDETVFDYIPEKASGLSGYIKRDPSLIFECHSTDYQTAGSLRDLVEDQFAILKVGPGLTFAFREALFALAAIEGEIIPDADSRSNLKDNLEKSMLENPKNWKKHYHGDEDKLKFARKYSFSDRSRYYWPVPALKQSVEKLIYNLRENRPPLTALSQYLPKQYTAVRLGKIGNDPVEIIHDKIMEVTSDYSYACGTLKGE
ncbi:MAG: D-tagatose-bisphosphate aldolase, class II, non-catalytic subunit [Fibrobacterota bacterium]